MEISSKTGKGTTGRHLGDQRGLAVVGSKRQVELCHLGMMSTKRPRQPKKSQCIKCGKWYTVQNIGNHIQNCVQWDCRDDTIPSPEVSQLGELSDDDVLMDMMKGTPIFVQIGVVECSIG